VIAASRAKYGTPRDDVEAALFAKFLLQEFQPKPTKSKPAPAPPPTVAEAKQTAVPTETAPQIEPTESQRQNIPPIPAQISGQPKKTEPPQPTAGEPAEQTPSAPAMSPTRDLGRGGAQHKAIQKRIKEAAEKAGFHGTIEKETSSGKGSVDLFLERGPQVIACEISVSTTVDHEVGNVEKCLKDKIPAVAVICLDGDRLRRIRDAVSGSLGQEAAASVTYFLPDDFIAHLETLPYPIPPEMGENRLDTAAGRAGPGAD
jgi:hypothetical protein